MDVIEYKLASKNPVLISHAVSRLYEIIKEKYKDGTSKDVIKIPEYKLLISKLESKDRILTTSICQALVSLVECGVLSITSVLCTLISHVSSTNNYTAITVSMSQLLILDLKLHGNQDKCLFTSQVPQYPFITILKEEKNSWRAVLDQMHFIMNHPDRQIKEKSLEMLRSVFIFILCDPSSSLSDACREKAWQLLIKSDDALELQIEILLWLRTNDVHTCLDTYYKIVEFAKVCLSKNDKDSCIALLPLLSSLCIWFLEYGLDPILNLDIISAIINKYNNLSGNVMLALMCEMILVCPAYYLGNVLQVCKLIVNKMSCNITLINALIASILKWMPYPSILCAEALAIANDLINNIVSEAKWTKDASDPAPKEIFAKLIHCDPYVQFYTESITLLNSLTEANILSWLKILSKSPIDLRYKYRLILSGLFLQSNDLVVTKAICDILMQITREIIVFASHMLPLIMHRLSKSHDYNELRYLLLALPELVITKENIPIISRTLQTLLHGKGPLKYFALELYLTMQDRDPRCYQYLSSALMETLQTDQSWYADVTCAKVIKHICEERPEYAEELVPLISKILNKCVDVNGSTATVLALKGIAALCNASVISITSVWKVLAPKMKREKRTIVMTALCELFAEIPSFPNRSSEGYDILISNVLEILWSYVFLNDKKISEVALKAIAMYRLQDIPLKTLPADFKCGLEIPQSSTSTSSDATKMPEDTLEYVPGTCWIQMLEKVNKVNKILLPSAGNILISFITNEIKGFRFGIYNWPHGEPNNFKYLPERSVIRAVGEYLRRLDKTKPIDESVAVECLRIFSFKYPKPLPNINWRFLHKTSEISDKAKEYSLTIACHHSVTSLSARNFVEHYLSMYENEKNLTSLLESREHEILYANLEDLCEAMHTQKIKPFLDATLTHTMGNLLSDDSENVIFFENIMRSYARALKNDGTNDAIRTLFSTTLEKLLDEIDLTCARFKPYISAVLALPIEHIERMTSPNVWWETPIKKLQNSITIRAELAVSNETEMPLKWMNELIDLIATMPEVQPYLLQEVQRVQTEVRSKMYTSDWVLDFINCIRAFIPEVSSSKNKIVFYCDVFIISIICLSGMDSLITDVHSITSSQHVRARLFPQAIAMLADIQYWKDHVIPQVMEWLHQMRTSCVPELYKSVFHNSLISLKHHPHYNKSWITYLSVKTTIQEL
ncbi:hypothetical protein KPH14_002126 [Odynerus spinipes]|uniref:DUF3730 domain-containing protein n=1 Tax=Odynerus spinipes TaxID=1348599 RepID=A0AAD9RKV6_9HYME|nr:hypothetical protein KPH14_002126 [Odynerus spinipes]